jgi:mannose-6-phosphate isomerase-like protein (cupin superfamily)
MKTASGSETEKFEERPWGNNTILNEGASFKVKRIEVLPGARRSCQKHSHRAERWFVVEGTAGAALDGKEIAVAKGETIDIPRTARQIRRRKNSF